MAIKSESEFQNVHPKNVLVGPYFVLSWLYKPMIPLMRQKWGARCVILSPEGSNLQTEYSEFCTSSDVFAEMPIFAEMIKKVGVGSDAETFKEAAENEARYRINYIQDIYQQERDVARGFVSGTSSAVFRNSDGMMAGALARTTNLYFKLYEDIFERYQIDLAMVWPRSGNEAICAAVAARRGVLVTYPYPAKYKNYMRWAAGASCGNYQYRRAYEEVDKLRAPVFEDSLEFTSPLRPRYLDQGRIDQRYSFRNAIRQILFNCVDRVFHLWGDFRAGRLGRANRLRLNTINARILASWNYYRKFSRLCERSLDKITSAPFVFFAFQNEPEFSVQMRCKEFNDQGAVARQLAMSLPVGVNLVIKEHTWLGGHRIDFYRDLVSLPNVIMAHPSIRAVDLIPQAIVTASFGGSVTFEALMLGKPAIVFNERSEFSPLPSVSLISDLSLLRGKLMELISPCNRSPDACKRDAARFMQATKDIGIEANPLFDRKDMTFETEQVEKAMLKLLKLLKLHIDERALGRYSLDS